MDHVVTGNIIGCALKVHNGLGSGFLESVYQRALAVEMARQHLEFLEQAPIHVRYCQSPVGLFVADFVVEHTIIVEIKAIQQLTPVCEAQLINYLKATGFGIGLLLNFGSTSLQVKRKVNQIPDGTSVQSSAKSD